MLDLLSQIVRYSVAAGRLFHTPVKGIARGSAISPLFAAFHLYAIDHAFAAHPHLVYVRYLGGLSFYRRRLRRRGTSRLSQPCTETSPAL
ncbi:hypothetical protein [Mycetohabitans rhizoxinica]|uniref:hypothetical protein n=1 Tax=Mycetohabitans rhizoxinica TaxID=412963 RepID=UPI0030D2A066